MPKLLKFILNCFAVVTALGYLFVLLGLSIDLVMGWSRRTQGELWSLALIPIVLHRVLIMLGEFVFVRSYLTGKSVNKELFKINMYVVFSLFLSSIFCMLYVLKLLGDILQVNRWESVTAWQYIFWGLIVLIMSLVAVAEVYVKTDYFMEKHLTTNPKKVVQLLSAIIIPVYILWVAGFAFYVYIISGIFTSPIIG